MSNQLDQDVPKIRFLRKLEYFFRKYDLVIVIIIIILIILMLFVPIILYKSGIFEGFQNNLRSTIDISNIDININASGLMTDTKSKSGSSDGSGISNIVNINSTPEEIKLITDNEIGPILNKYKSLDIPIIVNNSGKICNTWRNYQSGLYADLGNKCAAIDTENPSEYYCVDTTNNLVSCNNYTTQANIRNMQIDIDEIVGKNGEELLNKLKIYDNKLSQMGDSLDEKIAMIKSKGVLANNQDYFYTNNNNNLNAKKQLNQNFQKVYDVNTNAINMEKEKIINYQELNENIVKSNNFYYKILKYTAIILIIAIVANIALTKY